MTTRSLLSLADRLRCLGVTRVVLEATSDHWKPVFYPPEAHGLEVWLFDSQHVKHLPGRPKIDKWDVVWPRGGLGALPPRSRLLRRGSAAPGVWIALTVVPAMTVLALVLLA
ncbi:hypothetical protein [Microbispora rosea]|uniref:hypothetical protein n=1 Tax=Microbispora rosea TaxID=58117 RepID=UPI003D944A1E